MAANPRPEQPWSPFPVQDWSTLPYDPLQAGPELPLAGAVPPDWAPPRDPRRGWVPWW